jgi:hypothetical protein
MQLEMLKQELAAIGPDWSEFQTTARLVTGMSRTLERMGGGDPNIHKINQVLTKSSSLAMSAYMWYTAAATLSAGLGNPFAVAALATSTLMLANEIMQPTW